MIEKPKPEQIMSNYAILGRALLTSEIYDILDETPLGAGGELQLTDAMATLARSTKEGGMTAVDFEGKRYDMGSKFGFIMANIDRSVNNDELGEDVRRYIKELVENDFKIK
jgi:UTP--glucose-1-phosphate uridylyltransferase